MFTSRAEYRLLLREDNADQRLLPLGYELGLISKEQYDQFLDRRQKIKSEIERLKKTFVFENGFKQPESSRNGLVPSSAEENGASFASAKGTEVNGHPNGNGSNGKGQKASLFNLLRRPWVSWGQIAKADLESPKLEPALAAKVEVEVKYSGYVERQKEEIKRFQRMENLSIPDGFDYSSMAGLKKEAREKLTRLRPATIGQASRISGITPSDISILLIFLRKSRSGSEAKP